MGWGNPIVNGENLVISGIRSQNYQESTAGWRIGKDGSAQFTNLNSLGDFGASGDISAESFHVGQGGLWLPNDTEVGARLDAIDSYPQIGQVWRGGWMLSSATLNNLTGASAYAILELDTGFIPKVGWYGFYVSPILAAFTTASTNGRIAPKIRGTQTTDGVTIPGAPTTSSSIFWWGPHFEANGTAYKSGAMVWHQHFQAGIRQRLNYVVEFDAGFSAQIFNAQAISWVMIYHGNTENNTNYDGVYGTGMGTTGGTNPGSTPQTYTKTYSATWSRTYDGDNTTTFDDSPSCYQGYYSNDRGNTKSLVGFNYAQIQADLAGASVSAPKLTFKVKHSYYNAGVDVFIGKHDYTSKPSTWNSANVDEQVFLKSNAVAGSTYTTALPSGWATEFKNGTARGIAFGPGINNALDYYGYMYGATETGKPYLTFTYSK